VRCLTTSFLFSLIAQLAIAFNELYDVRVSSSRFDRRVALRRVAGSAIGLVLLAAVLVDRWELRRDPRHAAALDLASASRRSSSAS
jgi:hypothetical protein